MAWVLVPLGGAYDGDEANLAGQPLDLPWDGCELHRLEGLPNLYAAVATAEAKDWLIGVRMPLLEGERVPDLAALAGPDPEVRQTVLAEVETALRRARSIAARYLALPWPSLVRAGEPNPFDAGTRAGWEALAELQAAVGVQVVLEAAGSPAGERPQGLLLGWSWPAEGGAASPGAAPSGEGTASDPAAWADHLRLPADWLAPGPAATPPRDEVTAWLGRWAQAHLQGRLVLAPPTAGPVAPVTSAALALARSVLGRGG